MLLLRDRSPVGWGLPSPFDRRSVPVPRWRRSHRCPAPVNTTFPSAAGRAVPLPSVIGFQTAKPMLRQKGKLRPRAVWELPRYPRGRVSASAAVCFLPVAACGETRPAKSHLSLPPWVASLFSSALPGSPRQTWTLGVVLFTDGFFFFAHSSLCRLRF